MWECPNISVLTKDCLFSAKAKSWNFRPERCLLEVDTLFVLDPCLLRFEAFTMYIIKLFFLELCRRLTWTKGTRNPGLYSWAVGPLLPSFLLSFLPFSSCFSLMKVLIKIFFVLFWLHWVQVIIFPSDYILSLSSPCSRNTLCEL